MGPWCHIHRPGPCGPLPPVRSQGGRSPPGWWASTLIVEGLCLALKTVGGKLMDFMPVHLVGQICSSSDYLFFTRRNAPGFSENLGSLVWGASWLQLLQALCDVGSSPAWGARLVWPSRPCGTWSSAVGAALPGLWCLLVPLPAYSVPRCSTSAWPWSTDSSVGLPPGCLLTPGLCRGHMQGPPLLGASAQLHSSHQPEGLSPQ